MVLAIRHAREYQSRRKPFFVIRFRNPVQRKK